MNKEQVKGTAKEIAGRAQEKWGEVIDSRAQRAKGQVKQVEGKFEKAVGNARQAAEKLTRR